MSGADTGEGQAALVRPCGPLVVDMAWSMACSLIWLTLFRVLVQPIRCMIRHCMRYPIGGHPTPKNPGGHPRSQSTPQASKISKCDFPKHLKLQKALPSHLLQSFLTALVSPTMSSSTMIREITPQMPQTPCRALQKPCDWFHQIRHTVGQDRQGLPDKERQLSMNTNSRLLYFYRVQTTCFCLLIARKRQYLFVRKDI